MTTLIRLIRSTRAATAIEYGLIAALIAVAGLVSFQNVTDGILVNYNAISDAFN